MFWQLKSRPRYLLCDVLSRSARVLVMVALCLSIGTHWAALQSVAWATMLIHNSQRASLAEAFAKTFDGQHPCNLCKGVAAAQHSEKKGDAQPLTVKPDLICATRVVALTPSCAEHVFAPYSAIASARVSSPPAPPPRPQLA